MSVAVVMQKAVFDALRANAAVSSLVAGRVYDRVPANAKLPYVSFSSYDFAPADADCIDAGDHTLQVDVWSRTVGRAEAMGITDAIRRALHGYETDLGIYALVGMRVVLVQVIGDPKDRLTSHGIVQVTATIEEPA